MNGKPSPPVLKGLGASNGARPLDEVLLTLWRGSRGYSRNAEVL